MSKINRRRFLSGIAGAGFLLSRVHGKTALSEESKEASRIRWFRKNFDSQLRRTVSGTTFSTDLLCAVALQETGYIWGPLAEKQYPLNRILELCVGDTLDYPKRSATAFPKNKAALLKVENGAKMFEIAREALVQLGTISEPYRRVAEKYPDKFCHGYGIFQYDLQYFLTNPDFFLEKRWNDFEECIGLFVKDELILAQERAGYGSKKELTDREQIEVAIAYNRGRVDPKRGLKQGHRNPETGKYYGEYIHEYMKLSKSLGID